jgi:hypothetical protein
MAAMIGFFGGASTMPPKPLPARTGKSPVMNPFRSMPEENVPPAPVRT